MRLFLRAAVLSHEFGSRAGRDSKGDAGDCPQGSIGSRGAEQSLWVGNKSQKIGAKEQE